MEILRRAREAEPLAWHEVPYRRVGNRGVDLWDQRPRISRGTVATTARQSHLTAMTANLEGSKLAVVLPRRRRRRNLARGQSPHCIPLLRQPWRARNALDPPEPSAALRDVNLPLFRMPPPESEEAPAARGHVDHFRTDDAEHAELAARARDAGLSVDAFCRLKTLGDPGPRSQARPADRGQPEAGAAHHRDQSGGQSRQSGHPGLERDRAEGPGSERPRPAGRRNRGGAGAVRAAIPALMEALPPCGVRR